MKPQLGFRRLVAIEYNSFMISIKEITRGRFHRLVERGRGRSNTIFVEKEQIEWLASMLEEVVRGDRNHVVKKGSCRNVRVHRKQNDYGHFIKVVEMVPGDRNFYICVPTGEELHGWRVMRQYLLKAKEVYDGMKRKEKETTYNNMRSESCSYKEAVQNMRTIAEGSRVMETICGQKILKVGMNGRTEHLRLLECCIIVRGAIEKGTMEEFRRWAAHWWCLNENVPVVEYGENMWLCQCPIKLLADPIIQSGWRIYKDGLIEVKRWGENMAGSTKEGVWIREEGLPLPLRSMAIFHEIGDLWGGLIRIRKGDSQWLEPSTYLKVKGTKEHSSSLNLEFSGETFAIKISIMEELYPKADQQAKKDG